MQLLIIKMEMDKNEEIFRKPRNKRERKTKRVNTYLVGKWKVIY